MEVASVCAYSVWSIQASIKPCSEVEVAVEVECELGLNLLLFLMAREIETHQRVIVPQTYVNRQLLKDVGFFFFKRDG